MNLKEYLPTNEAFSQVSGAESVGAGKYLLQAARIRRDKERELNENHPKRDDNDLRNDFVYKAGFIAAMNWILDLPGKARDQLNKLPEGD